MKHKMIKIIIPIILVLSVVAAINYFFNLDQIIVLIHPSDEMKRLKQIEDSFNLPPSSNRYVVDKGSYVDGKGAPQYSRSISNYYEDKKLITLVKEKVEKSGWVLEHTSVSLAGGTDYKYINREARTGIYRTEIYITINPKLMGDPRLLDDDHGITIRSRIEEWKKGL